MLLLRAVYLGLVMLQLSGMLEAKLNYAVTFPSEIVAPQSEQACVYLTGMDGDSRIQVTLNMAKRNTTVIEKNLQQNDFIGCATFEVPPPSEGNEEVATMEILIESSGETITKSSKVLVRRMRTRTFIQTDKAIYKPGQTVKFRVVSLKENLDPGKNQLPVIKLQDPNKNRIAQWLNVTLKQGITELSFPLSSEVLFGQYSICVGDNVNFFTVKEYVLPKFEVSLQLPKVVPINSEQFQLKTCGRYTYGKPVQGTYEATVCSEPLQSNLGGSNNDRSGLCVDFSGKLDRSGCSMLNVTVDNFSVAHNTYDLILEGISTITEEGTGIKHAGRGKTTISSKLMSCSFLEADTIYKPGIPYRGRIQVLDASDEPVPNQTIYLTSTVANISMALVSDKYGVAFFSFEDTSGWEFFVDLKANLKMMDTRFHSHQYGSADLTLHPFHSLSKSFLKLPSIPFKYQCADEVGVLVKYIIRHSALGMDTKHLDLQYMIVSKGTIKDAGSLKVRVENQHEGSSVHRGWIPITFKLNVEFSSTLRALVFAFLPNGELVADSGIIKLTRCLKNTVSVGFSPDEVLPGSDVSVQVQAAAGSLCGLRVVDKSVVLMKPDKELTADKILGLFPFPDFEGYDSRVQDAAYQCPDYGHLNHQSAVLVPSRKRSLRRYYIPEPTDVYSLFKNMRIKIVTSAEIKKCWKEVIPMREEERRIEAIPALYDEMGRPVRKPATEIVQAYFPETWIWELAPVNNSRGLGHSTAKFHRSAPDTITDWTAGAFCMGPSGFGISPPTSLRVFQPFFVELTLPYSVVRGVSFTLKASVFNYLKKCIKVQTTLLPALELEEEPCADCQYSSCLCAEESKTFYWNLKASDLGEANITVRTEALNTQDMCNNETPIVPKQGNINTVIKPLRVQSGGIIEEKSYSSLLCSHEGQGHSKAEEMSLKVPKNILNDTERAYITVLGDMMGTAMQNLDHFLAMPYGCGEQSMVLFASNVFILQYLEKTRQLSPEIQSKAKRFLESGYQRQLTYSHGDGSYNVFGKSDREGNTWLTAFVVKSFNKARPYIFIDENHLSQSFSWLKEKRKRNGCFQSVGKLFNNAMKGVDDEISLSAYVTIALMEAGLSTEDTMVEGALSCLRKAAKKVSSIYTQALLAFTFTLSNDTELREMLLAKLDEKAVRKDGQINWEHKPSSEASDFPSWYRASSAEVELTSYVLLALLSGPTKNLAKASEIVNWLSKQQNPYGGFSSTQDTVVALQALAKYAEATFTDKGDVTVTVSSKTGFHQQFHVDHTNRLLLQKSSLPDIPGDYSLSASGSGCVYVQTVLRYDIPPPRSDATFSVQVETQPIKCPKDPMKQLCIDIYIQYTGSREKSNMALVEVKLLSGFIPLKNSVKKLVNSNTIKRNEIQSDIVTLYLNELGRDRVHLSFLVVEDIKVKNLKPATVKVYDYYETAEYAVTEYNSPCSSGKNMIQI